MAIPPSFIQDLLSRTDVVDIVGKHVQLKKGGANFSGLCPFHAEKSPSFTVSPSKQFYHCFGCGKNGNAIGFLMDFQGMGFIDAVKDLAQQVGLQVPEDDRSPQDRAHMQALREKQLTLTDVLEKAAVAYQRHLASGSDGISRGAQYFKGRGVSGEIAKTFGLGYAPEGWRALAGVFPDYTDPLLVESGLVIYNDEEAPGDEAKAKRYDRFRDRVMFPIRNVKGECIGFGGRVLGDDKPKYLNSPETPVFSKGRELYGLFEARQHLREAGYVLVTEGYMDVVALAQLGFPNAVATLGTACTDDHVQKLFRFTDAVVFSFDGDAAGRRAARKALDAAIPFASDTRSVKFLFLPPEHDPDSYIREFGKEGFARFVGEAVPLSRFLIEAAREGCELATVEGRSLLASQAKPLWLGLPDGALKRQLLGELSRLVDLSERNLLDLWMPQSPQQRGQPGRVGYGKDGQAGNQGHYQNRSWPWASHPGNRPKALEDPGSRQAPASSADHLLRILLGQAGLWQGLSAEEHEMLCALPAPHGPLFTWLDAQWHEHGAQPWGLLREGLRGHPQEDLATRLVAKAMEHESSAAEPDSAATQASAAEAASAELRQLLNRMLVERLKLQESEAIRAASSDPGALQRYRDLQKRRTDLERQSRELAATRVA